MQIKCPECGISVEVSDERLPDTPVMLTCKNCGHSFSFQKRTVEAAIQHADIEQLDDGRVKVICPSCDSEHIIDSSKLPAGEVKAKCRSCGAQFTFIVGGNK